MEAIIKKWGNSLGLRIPGLLAKSINIAEGSLVDIDTKDGKIEIKPLKKQEYDLDEMLQEIDESCIHDEIETGAPIGKEL